MTIRTVLAGALLASVFAAPAVAQDIVFTLDNQSSGAVNEIYVAPLDSDNWEEDILGQDVLESGQQATITLENAGDQCAFDVRLVYDDGSYTDERNIDLCELENATYEVTD